MKSEPIWIREDAVLAIHRRQLAEHGGFEGVRDAGLLSSALYRPQQLFMYAAPTLSALAAAYAFGIARNHPFLDGNKRTAYVCARLFLKLNGYDMIATQQEKYAAVIALASGAFDEATFAAWVASVCQKA